MLDTAREEVEPAGPSELRPAHTCVEASQNWLGPSHTPKTLLKRRPLLRVSVGQLFASACQFVPVFVVLFREMRTPTTVGRALQQCHSAIGQRIVFGQESLNGRRGASRLGSSVVKGVPVFSAISGCCAMSSLLTWQRVPMAQGGSLPFCTRWQTAGVEGSGRFVCATWRVCLLRQ